MTTVAESRERAYAEAEELGFIWSEPFHGVTKPWRGVHEACGRSVTPRWNNVRKGQGVCRFCKAEEALTTRSTKPRKHVSAAESRERAYAEAEELGFAWSEPFPGTQVPWEGVHEACDRSVAPRWNNVRNLGHDVCRPCSIARVMSERVAKFTELASTEVDEHDFTPSEPYPGQHKPWRGVHNVCGKEVSPQWGNVIHKGKSVCVYCASGGYDDTEPGRVYLVRSRELSAIKVGITNVGSRDRLADHRRNGWQTIRSFDFTDGEVPPVVERLILEWWRDELNVKSCVHPDDMPQTGHTETAPDHVLAETVRMLDELVGMAVAA